jgi:hypothetical protein
MGSWELIKYVLLLVIIIFGLASIIATGGGGGGGGGSLPAGGASGGNFPSHEITITDASEINKIQDEHGKGLEIAGHQILAEFADNATSEHYYQLKTFLEDRNAKIVGQIPPIGMVQIETVLLSDVVNLVLELRELHYIEDAYPNEIVSQVRETDIPEKGEFWWAQRIKLQEAWDLFGDQDQIGSPYVKIGIVDNWIDKKYFDDLKVDGGTEPRITELNPPTHEIDDHGTGVAALAAGDRNDDFNPMVGVAPDTPILWWDLTKDANGNYGKLNEAITSCILAGSKVVNLSYGAGPKDEILQSQKFRWKIRKNIRLAHKEKRLVVLASGNLQNQEDNALFPSGAKREDYWRKFYDYAAIVVTGTDKNDNVYYHYGNSINLAAPGRDVSKADHDSVYSWSGSSLSAPQVTGAAALIWSANPNLKPCEVKRVLTDTGRRIERTESGDDIRKYNIRTLDLYNALTHTELTSPGPLTATIISPPGDVIIYEGESVYFDVSVKGETCTSRYEYFWTFGGGIPDYYGLVPGNGTFSTAGTYNVYFAVTNSADPWEYDYDSVRVIVNEIPEEEFRVNTYTSNDQRHPSVAGLASGGFVVTWESEGQDGSGWGIYGQRYDSAGTKVGGEFRVNTYINDNQFGSSVAGLSGGGFVTAWESFGQDGSYHGIFGQIYDSSGNRVGVEFQVNTSTFMDQVAPSVSGLSNGGFVVSWTSGDGNGFGIYGQRFDSSGTKVGGEFRVNTYTDNEQMYSSVASLDGGGFGITWESSGQDGSSSGIYGQRYDSSGAMVGGEFQVNTYTYYPQTQPSVAGLSDGGFVVTWESYEQDGSSWGIYGQRFDSSGTKVGGEFRVNTYTADYQGVPSVDALPRGGFVVTWGSFGQDGSGWGIYGQRYDSAGTKVGGEFRVNTYINDSQFGSSVAGLSGGGFVVTWGSFGQDGSGYGIYGRRF